MISQFYWNDPAMITLALVALGIAMVSTIADQLRQRRKRADNVGFMPWPTITIGSLFLAMIALTIALHGG